MKNILVLTASVFLSTTAYAGQCTYLITGKAPVSSNVGMSQSQPIMYIEKTEILSTPRKMNLSSHSECLKYTQAAIQGSRLIEATVIEITFSE